jgi:hypothetical protein
VEEVESRSHWVFGVSLVQVVLLLCFAALILYVTEQVEVSGQEPQSREGETAVQGGSTRAHLDDARMKTAALEQQVGDMTALVDDLKLMVGAKTASKEGFQEAVDTLKRGYALCQKDDNTLIEARIQNGAETVMVLAEIPSDLVVTMTKGEQTSDLEEIVSFLQEVYEYEKDHKCRFNYRLKYATDNDYRKGRDGYEKYFYPEKLLRTG